MNTIMNALPDVCFWSAFWMAVLLTGAWLLRAGFRLVKRLAAHKLKKEEQKSYHDNFIRQHANDLSDIQYRRIIDSQSARLFELDAENATLKIIIRDMTPKKEKATCRRCRGAGDVVQWTFNDFGNTTAVIPCPSCQGDNHISPCRDFGPVCTHCNGKGFYLHNDTNTHLKAGQAVYQSTCKGCKGTGHQPTTGKS